MDFKEFETKTEQLCGIIIKTDSEFWETKNKVRFSNKKLDIYFIFRQFKQ